MRWRRRNGHAFDHLPEAERIAIVPDIKKNKTLYWIWGDEIMPVLYKGVIGGCVSSDKKFHVTCLMTTKKSRTFIHSVHRKMRQYTFDKGDERLFYHDDIGKIVFLTHAEAILSLKKMEAAS